MLFAAAILAAPCASAQQDKPAGRAEPPDAAAASDVVAPPGLPTIGKWMIAADGSVAHWLGELLDGKRLREPINIVIVDRQATTVAAARQR